MVSSLIQTVVEMEEWLSDKIHRADAYEDILNANKCLHIRTNDFFDALKFIVQKGGHIQVEERELQENITFLRDMECLAIADRNRQVPTQTRQAQHQAERHITPSVSSVSSVPRTPIPRTPIQRAGRSAPQLAQGMRIKIGNALTNTYNTFSGTFPWASYKPTYLKPRTSHP